MLDKIDFYKKDLKYIRYLTQAGGKLNLQINKKIAENFYNNNKDFIVMYGAAEATARMSYLPSEFSCKKIGSIGVPIPGGKFWIEDNNQKKIEKENEIGELYYSGKNVCLGYAENINDLSKGDENKGILKTGDIAKKDKDNFYYILGRNDRFVKIFGNRINLDELENSNYAKNTIVMLWGDHGWHLGEKQHWRKQALWEDTTHVPFIISFPAKISQNQICNAP